MQSKYFVIISSLVLSLITASPTWNADNLLERRARPNTLASNCGHKGCGSENVSDSLNEGELNVDSLSHPPPRPMVADATPLPPNAPLPKKETRAEFNNNMLPEDEPESEAQPEKPKVEKPKTHTISVVVKKKKPHKPKTDVATGVGNLVTGAIGLFDPLHLFSKPKPKKPKPAETEDTEEEEKPKPKKPKPVETEDSEEEGETEKKKPKKITLPNGEEAEVVEVKEVTEEEKPAKSKKVPKKPKVEEAAAAETEDQRSVNMGQNSLPNSNPELVDTSDATEAERHQHHQATLHHNEHKRPVDISPI